METCPAKNMLKLLGQKWILEILTELKNLEVARFNQLYKNLNSISPKTLSTRLQELESNNLIVKKQYNEIPPKVEYSLTQPGKELIECFKHIDKWAAKWQK